MSAQPSSHAHATSQAVILAAWQRLRAGELNTTTLLNFHASHKYLLLAHSPEHYRLMGQLLANLRHIELTDTADHYARLLRAAIETRPSRRSHSNVLEHIAGYFKRALSTAEKAELHQSIDQYRHGLVSLEAPIGLLRQHLLAHPHDYLAQQVYLHPHSTSRSGP